MGISIDVLLDAIAWVESRWQSQLVSYAGAVGYYQIKPSVAKWLGYDSKVLWNEDEARIVAKSYLEWLINYFDGNITSAIIAYNYGPGNVKRGKFKLHYYYRVLGAVYCLQHKRTLPQTNRELEQLGFIYELAQRWFGIREKSCVIILWWHKFYFDIVLREKCKRTMIKLSL